MIKRNFNFLGQARVDAPHLRSLESSLCNDFDVLAGRVMAGSMPLVITGFEIVSPAAAIGTSAATLQLNVANGVLFHPNASESGTVFSVAAGTPAETLSSTNSSVSGSFTPSATNYIGIDLIRTADDSTADLVEFLSANSLQEVPRIVPLGRTLNYKIIISTANFDTDSTVLPIAIVTTDSGNAVAGITDARNMMYSLASGGSAPDTQYAFPWTQGRVAPSYFTGGDKTIGDMKSFNNAIMTRLWELGGGEHWYSATSDRDVELAYGPPLVLGFGSQNFVWTGTNLTWAGLSLLFANSTATYNVINDNPTPGLPLADGQCLYVDVDRTTNGAIINMQGPIALSSLGSPIVPGSRFVIAWMHGTNIFTRGAPYQLGRVYANPASTGGAGGLGLVSLCRAAADPTDPVVIPLDANGQCINTPSSGTNKAGFVGTGRHGGSGLVGTGDDLGSGVSGYGSSTNHGYGGYFVGSTGGDFTGGVGVCAQGGSPNANIHPGGHGVYSTGGTAFGSLADGHGVVGIGGGTAGAGVMGVSPGQAVPAGGLAVGIYGVGGAGSGSLALGAGGYFVGGVGSAGNIGGTGAAGQGGTGATGQNGGIGGYFSGGDAGAGGSSVGPAISLGSGEIVINTPRTRNIVIPAQQMYQYNGTNGSLYGDAGGLGSWANVNANNAYSVTFAVNIPVGSVITNAQILCVETGGITAIGGTFNLNYFSSANMLISQHTYTSIYNGFAFNFSAALAWVPMGAPANSPTLTDGGTIQGTISTANIAGEKAVIYAVQITYTQAEVAYNI